MKLFRTINQFLHHWLDHPRWGHILGVGLFIGLTLIIHYAWRFWAYQLDYWPIAGAMNELGDYMVNRLLIDTYRLVRLTPGYPAELVGNGILYPDQGGIIINQSCNGFKQIAQFVILMLIYPGPWAKKAWYIPLGAVIVHLVNLFRIYIIGLLAWSAPNWVDFTHDYLLRGFFYVVIFVLWLIWEERMRVPRSRY